MLFFKNIFRKANSEEKKSLSNLDFLPKEKELEIVNSPTAERNQETIGVIDCKSPIVNKTEQVREHLASVGYIDTWTAIEKYGATRLSSIIFNLRKSGYCIESIPKSVVDKNGNNCNFTKYVFINDKKK